MSRSLKMLGVATVIAAGAGIFQLKYTIEAKDRELRALEAQFIADQKAIRVLEAEWAYLNSPAYLQELSVRYLGLRPALSDQVLDNLESLPWRKDLSRKIIPQIDFVMPSPRMKPYFDYEANVSSLMDEVGKEVVSLELVSMDGGER